jgi:putative addiction module component (TIGR02574 family)
MLPTLQSIGIDRLNTDERLALAEAIFETVDLDGIDPDLKSEPERRLALADADPSRGKSWETVLEKARARWKR